MSGSEPLLGETRAFSDWLVITDLDGTIIDSEKSNFKFLGQLLVDFELIEHKATIFKGLAEGRNFIDIMKDIGMSTEKRKAMEERLIYLLTQVPPPSLPGASKHLKYLRDLGLIFSIATDNYSQFVVKVLKDHNLEDIFDDKLILTSDRFPARKPSPEITDELMRRSGCKKVIIIGNSPKEIALARNSGCSVVIIQGQSVEKKDTFDYEWQAVGGYDGSKVQTVTDWDAASEAVLRIVGADIVHKMNADQKAAPPSLEEFLIMTDEKVAALVSASPEGRVGVLVPDGNRKAGLVIWGFDPSKKDFDKDLFNSIHSKFLTVVQTFFENGVRTLFIPLLMHSNFDRGKAYMDAAMSDGLNHLFIGEDWHAFYDQCDIRVRFYGDIDYISSRGYDKLVGWIRDLEQRTKEHKSATLFYGVACNRSVEEVRLVQIGSKYVSKEGKVPTKEDLIRDYYGMDAPNIGFFIRPTEVRDSDVQPILISGSRTQMYFPVSPVGFLSKRVIRTMLYDLIYCRVASGGKKMYSKSDITSANLNKVKEYYQKNMETVLGIGDREGPFWIPKDGTRMY
jgi:phosphoglycolate phosphatase-like HAD superfamily hydrolase